MLCILVRVFSHTKSYLMSAEQLRTRSPKKIRWVHIYSSGQKFGEFENLRLDHHTHSQKQLTYNIQCIIPKIIFFVATESTLLSHLVLFLFHCNQKVPDLSPTILKQSHQPSASPSSLLTLLFSISHFLRTHGPQHLSFLAPAQLAPLAALFPTSC